MFYTLATDPDLGEVYTNGLLLSLEKKRTYEHNPGSYYVCNVMSSKQFSGIDTFNRQFLRDEVIKLYKG